MDNLQTTQTPPTAASNPPVNKRPEFLLEMYKQMMNDINRHILVVWQSVGVVAGSFAIFALVEKKVVSLDIATTLVLLICSWSLAHVLDAGYWYNRNLCIVANIERQFLFASDLKDIHSYFGAHRPDNALLTHLRIQAALAVGIAAIVLLVHAWERVRPGLNSPWNLFEVLRALPYIVAAVAAFSLWWLSGWLNRKYFKFKTTSPGIAVDTTGIRYGIDHGFDR